MLLIGSQATIHLGIDLGRYPSDIDLIATWDEFLDLQNKHPSFKPVRPAQSGKKIIGRWGDVPVEIEIAWAESTAARLIELVGNSTSSTFWPVGNPPAPVKVAPPWALLALKMSHRYLKDSPHFLKTMRDIQLFRSLGWTVPIQLKGWLKDREAETYHYSHPSLNRTKSEFFSGDGVRYVYDHDSIHEAMKIGSVPAYTLFRKDGAQVQVDREKWEQAPYGTKIASVLEETYVLALERSQIPFRDRINPKTSFNKALEKVCTSITSGWWREWAWEHYDDAQYRYDPNYTDKFWAAVESGIVKPL